MPDVQDPRLIRLIDLKEHEHIFATCPCGRIVQFMPGVLERLHHLASDTLVYDLQYRLRCVKCGADRGFEIVIQDMRDAGYREKSRRQSSWYRRAESRPGHGRRIRSAPAR